MSLGTRTLCFSSGRFMFSKDVQNVAIMLSNSLNYAISMPLKAFIDALITYALCLRKFYIC